MLSPLLKCCKRSDSCNDDIWLCRGSGLRGLYSNYQSFASRVYLRKTAPAPSVWMTLKWALRYMLGPRLNLFWKSRSCTTLSPALVKGGMRTKLYFRQCWLLGAVQGQETIPSASLGYDLLSLWILACWLKISWNRINSAREIGWENVLISSPIWSRAGKVGLKSGFSLWCPCRFEASHVLTTSTQLVSINGWGLIWSVRTVDARRSQT